VIDIRCERWNDGMTRVEVSIEIAFANEQLAAEIAFEGSGGGFGVETCVLVEVGGIAKCALADLALEGFVVGVRAQMDLQAVLAGVQFAAVDTPMAR
jgi:hypothetical protein